MRHKSTAIGFILASALVVACGGHDVAAPEPETPTAHEMLDTHPWFNISPANSLVQMTARLNRGDQWIEDYATLGLVRGDLGIMTDASDNLKINQVDLFFDDVVAGAGVINEDGIYLTGIYLYAQGPAVAHTAWANDDDSAFAVAPIDLEFSWSIRVDGHVYDLAPQALPTIDFAFGLSVDCDDQLVIDITAVDPGTIWNWANIVEFSDLHITLHGTHTPVVW